jgi:DNA-binding NarL/FixJ family response regulator
MKKPINSKSRSTRAGRSRPPAPREIHTDSDHPQSRSGGMPVNPPAGQRFTPTDIRYWRERTIHRTHGKFRRPGSSRELSALIEHAGASMFFPLSTADKQAAALRALAIYRAVTSEGWPAALRKYSCEFTLAIFWAENPMVFTYATLYSAPEVIASGVPPRRRAHRSSKVSIAVVEADEPTGRGLSNWLNSLSDYTCAARFATGAAALASLKRQPVDLVLFNRQLPGLATGRFQKSLQEILPHSPIVGYRTYNSSDDLFYTQPAISGGYFFRRRTPESLLEPVRGAWHKGPPPPAEWQARICGYVQRLFLFPAEGDGTQEPSALTSREQDILGCLRSGSTDKEIACALGISAWTVHTHLKKVYAKLGARSRTEAIIKFLQK